MLRSGIFLEFFPVSRKGNGSLWAIVRGNEPPLETREIDSGRLNRVFRLSLGQKVVDRLHVGKVRTRNRPAGLRWGLLGLSGDLGRIRKFPGNIGRILLIRFLENGIHRAEKFFRIAFPGKTSTRAGNEKKSEQYEQEEPPERAPRSRRSRKISVIPA